MVRRVTNSEVLLVVLLSSGVVSPYPAIYTLDIIAPNTVPWLMFDCDC
jgi:hypothetical protein